MSRLSTVSFVLDATSVEQLSNRLRTKTMIKTAQSSSCIWMVYVSDCCKSTNTEPSCEHSHLKECKCSALCCRELLTLLWVDWSQRWLGRWQVLACGCWHSGADTQPHCSAEHVA